MGFWKHVKVSVIQKSMQLSWFFTFLACITFLDCLFFIQHGEGITILSWHWIKSTIDIIDILVWGGLFSFVFSVVLPGFWFSVWPFILFGFSKITKNNEILINFPGKGYHSLDTLYKRAAQESNMALFKHCEKYEADANSKNHLSLCSQGIILFSFGAWLFSNNESYPIIINLIISSQSQPWYIAKPAGLIAIMFCITIISMVGMRRNRQADYIFYPEKSYNSKIEKSREDIRYA